MATKTVSIKRKPSSKVTNLTTPARDGTKFSSSWKIPSGVTNQNDPSRWQRVRAKLRVQTIDKKYVMTANANVPAKAVKDTVVNDQTGASLTSIAKTLTRKDYYPLTSRLIKQVYASVWAHNSKGYGPENKSGMYWIDFPPKPTVTVSYDKDTGVTTFNIKNNTSNTNTVRAERYDTHWYITWISHSSALKQAKAGNSTSTDFNVSYDAPAANKLRDGEWIEVSVGAYNRGLRGDSAVVGKSKVICPPEVYEVSSIYKSGTGSNGFVHVATKSVAHEHTLVDQVQLQRLRNVDITDPDIAATSTDWEDVSGAVDNSNTTGLTDAYQDAVPEVGMRTWYRFKTTHDNYTRYGAPTEARVLYQAPPPAPDILDEPAGILYMGCTVGERYDEVSGEMVPITDPVATLQVGLIADNITQEADATGIELSWSEREYAWSSNAAPDALELNFSDTEIFVPGQDTAPDVGGFYWVHVGTVNLYDLDPSVSYYFKVRTYMEDVEGNKTYNDYSPAGLIEGTSWPYRMEDYDPTLVPSNLTIHAPRMIYRGDTIPVTWTCASDLDILESEVSIRHSSGGNMNVYSNLGKSESSVVILASDVKAKDESIDVAVTVRNRAGWCEPVVETVWIIDKPVISVKSSSPVTAQPFKFTMTVTKNYSSLVENLIAGGALRAVTKITSDGVSQQLPDRDQPQANGDVVWAGLLGSNDWHYSEDSSEKPYAEFELPEGLTLVDGASYTLETYLESDVNTYIYSGDMLAQTDTFAKPEVLEKIGVVKSGVVKQKFTVNWAHKAKPPLFDQCKAVGTSNGKTLTAKILPMPSPGTLKTDVVDVYRVTPDGAYPIAIGARFGSYVTDTLAPFSKTANLRYRLATRTRDGDISWIDVPYSLKHYPIRFDWGDGRFLEVPFNIKMNDSFEKDFEDRQHLDGGHPGYWNPGVKRTSSLSTQLIRIDLYNIDPLVKASDPEGLKELLRELAHYAGPVFVRTPDGCAYPANVSVSGIDSSYDSLVLDVSFDATEVDMTAEFQVESRNMTASTYTPTSSVAQSYTYKKGSEQRYKLIYAPSEGIVKVDFVVKDTNQTTKASQTTTVETLQASYDLTKGDDGFYYVSSSDLAWNAALKKLDDYQSEYGANGKLAKTVKITYK